MDLTWLLVMYIHLTGAIAQKEAVHTDMFETREACRSPLRLDMMVGANGSPQECRSILGTICVSGPIKRWPIGRHRVDGLGEGAVKPRWWEAFHAGRMWRNFIRHRAMYRIKPRLHVAFTYLTGALEGGKLIVFLLPFLIVAWWIAPRWFPSRADLLGPYDAFLLRCEIEDLHDELQRRSRRRGDTKGDA